MHKVNKQLQRDLSFQRRQGYNLHNLSHEKTLIATLSSQIGNTIS